MQSESAAPQHLNHGISEQPHFRDGPNPRGPKDQKISRFRVRLKISSENEIFERATHRGPFFLWGDRDVEIEIFERD